MAVYIYKAMTKSGLVVRNKVEAPTKQNLVKMLKDNDMLPISVDKMPYGQKRQKVKKKKNIHDMDEFMKNVNTTDIAKENEPSTREKIRMYFARSRKITQRDLVVFTQNFYLLKKANFNNIHALRTIIDGTENFLLQQILEDILAGLEAGENMYTTMEYYSDVFPYIYINMIKVGELSGSLTNSLEQAVKYLDDTNSVNKKLRNILIPNLIQFVLLIVMLVVGTLVAIPAIQNVYNELGSKDTLPKMTLWFQRVMNVAIAYWYIPVLIIIGAIVAIWLYVRTPKGKYNFDYFKYRAPIFGELVFAIDFSRLMKAMLLNLENGMRIQEALEVSKNVIKNYVMRSLIETSINNILIGASWIEPFEKSGLCKPMNNRNAKNRNENRLSRNDGKISRIYANRYR